MSIQGTLIAFGGLPGTGKTTLSKSISQKLNAVYLRIDTIEQTLLRISSLQTGTEGYAIAYAIAKDNLIHGKIVVTDSVNPIPETRTAWHALASETNSKLIEIEVICSNRDEHRRRVETRTADIIGHKMLTWDEVINRDYDVWKNTHIVIDTAFQNPKECIEIFLQKLKPLL